ncbi:penicillin-binding protein 1A [Mariprofundus ferrinatatus]|uniref:peptidoglycan glycosyltransferase n=1 Tax=Mariprofundus ferrinatatus TaxID=1921087 RepID=A0A2K8LE87_9PROT|nr:PBP1A family penicillin-binding protein [Mariprofundus ferrinatatus]ATX82596.1 penicillin-binding protein 1A [Mariprofundus ferrinatatus]
MRILSIIAKIVLSFSIIAVMCITIGYLLFSSNLPKLTALSDYQPPLVSRVYNSEGELIAEYADEHRILTPFEQIPGPLKKAFLAAEDQQFYEHPGINPARILSAALANLRAGQTVQGGSTITQQVAKNFLLSSERSYTRKIREAILAYRIEEAFSKDEILYLYLNHIYLGRGSYGVASAAWRYFHKPLDELTLGECATIAGLPKAPGKYAPHINLEKALQRRNTILHLMRDSGYAEEAEVEAALNEPLEVAELETPKLNDAYADLVLRQLTDHFGLKTLRRQGLTITVPLNPKMQEAAIRAVRHNVLEIEQRQFYRYPVNHAPETWSELLESWRKAREDKPVAPATDELIPALVVKLTNGDLTVDDGRNRWQLSKPSWTWKSLSQYQEDGATAEQIAAFRKRSRSWIAGDEIRLQGTEKGGVRLAQEPSIESALYAIDLEKGTVLARVGGYDYQAAGFDRVHQAMRQPGSAFKPFLYASALANGSTPATIVMDTPVVFDSEQSDEFWRPENYKDNFAGPVPLRNALEHSRNLASIKVLQNIGISRFLNDLQIYPMERQFPSQLALALGATEVSLEALTNSYAIMASQGKRWEPVSVQQVQDRNGNTLHRSVSGNRCQVCHVTPTMSANDAMRPAEQVLDPVDSFLITNMMKGVIERGTGQRAKALNRPAAGKTGTTNKQVDAWFMGYTPQIMTGVWTGRDTPTPMGRRETGAHAALPAWLESMQAFHEGRPVEDFTPPEDVEWVVIDAKTGLLPGPDSEEVFLEAFRSGTAPSEESPAINSPIESKPSEDAGFFELGL